MTALLRSEAVNGELVEADDARIAASQVHAAGGVVLARTGESTELAVVHRPRYDDWTLPKGKLEQGESFEDAALREVEEETGLRCRLGPEVGATSYTDNKGRSKLVRWWLMEPVEEISEPDSEVDAVGMLPLVEAAERLTYDLDRQVLAAALLVGS